LLISISSVAGALMVRMIEPVIDQDHRLRPGMDELFIARAG
jgi:hypothetical protein